MFNDKNLLDMDGVVQIDKYKTLVIGKQSQTYQVYRVPLRYLYYNDQNDRVSTGRSRFESTGGNIDFEDREKYNMIFEELIKTDRPDLLGKTQKSIRNRGQDNPGVTLNDGRVVDGNRRFTCLRLIERETNQEQYFETVILDMDYQHQYKLIKALEIELQMGVEEKIPYDPVDRLFGLYKSIRLDKAFTVEEYAELFDDKTPSDIQASLEEADLMCEFLDYIGCHNQFYIAKDLKLEGVFNEVPKTLKKVKKTNPDKVDDIKSLIFASILMGVSNRLNLFVRDDIGKLVSNPDDLSDLVEDTQGVVDSVRDLIETEMPKSTEDINEIRANDEIRESITSPVTTLSERLKNRSLQGAPLKLTREAMGKLNSIVVPSIQHLSDEDKLTLESILSDMSSKIEEMRREIDS